MSAKALLDTNIFLYSFDKTASAKRDKALELIESALGQHSAIISTQVIQEFLSAALR